MPDLSALSDYKPAMYISGTNISRKNSMCKYSKELTNLIVQGIKENTTGCWSMVNT
jgi:hypothetical protein